MSETPKSFFLAADEDPKLRHWVVSAAIVLAAHAGLLLWLAHQRDLGAAGAPPAVVMIDLPAMDTAPAPEAPPEAVEGPKTIEATPPKAESPKTMAVPKLPPAQKPPVVLAPPPKPTEKPKKKEIAKPAAAQTQEPPAPRTSAPKHPQAARGSAASTPDRSGTASSAAAIASWRTEIYAHLARHKPSSIEAKGVIRISFNLGRSGSLLGAHVAQSSGSPALDQWALEWVRRANPFPAAPSEFTGGPLLVTAPLRSR